MSLDDAVQSQAARIPLDGIIAAAAEGALRALEARGRSPAQGEGFFVDVHIRIGIPASVQQVLSAGTGPTSGMLEGAATE